MGLQTLDHYTVLTEDVDGSVGFYESVLGLKNGERPPFTFPGAWLYIDDKPVLHLIGNDQAASKDSGNFDHVAFRCNDYPGIKARLEENDVDYEERTVPRLDLKQIFLLGPEGVKVELNFMPEDQ
jgi:catechol 2,3-dioxygenase-like lactoylglutathione lyase family enzyme